VAPPAPSGARIASLTGATSPAAQGRESYSRCTMCASPSRNGKRGREEDVRYFFSTFQKTGAGPSRMPTRLLR
jgi:hypothetical protein